jgi:hypothetical protein
VPVVTALSDLLGHANHERLSARSIARRANAAGFSLNHDTAARYLRGDHGRPDEATLVAFATVLGIPIAALREAAGLPYEQTAPYTPPAEASRLTRRQRKAVDEIIRAMLEPVDRRGDVSQLSDRRRRSSGQRAARHGEPEPPAS